jgi:hypothetical protein
LLGRKPASRAVPWAIQKSAYAGVRPFDLALQAIKGLAKETPGLFRMVSASTTKMVAAIATASAVAEHLALERHRQAGGPRVAQEEQARWRVLIVDHRNASFADDIGWLRIYRNVSS